MRVFVRNYLLPILKPFNWSNPHLVVIMDNASIHHVQEVTDLLKAMEQTFFSIHLILIPLKKSLAKRNPS